jgi:hypothetical protein
MQRGRARSALIAIAAVGLAAGLTGPAVAWAGAAAEPVVADEPVVVPAAELADHQGEARPAGSAPVAGATSVAVVHGDSLLLLALGITLLAMGVNILRLAHRPDAHLR